MLKHKPLMLKGQNSQIPTASTLESLTAIDLIVTTLGTGVGPCGEFGLSSEVKNVLELHVGK